MKKSFVTFFAFSLIIVRAFAHGYEKNVIVDTDAAPDDLRAICMLLSREDINILAIITSDGALDPNTGAKKVKELLYQVGRTNIPVGVGQSLNIKPPEFRKFASSFYWGDEIAETKHPEAKKLLNKTIEKVDEVTFICLGPLTNVSIIINSSLNQKIEQIYWYSSYNTKRQNVCFNYNRDTVSAKQVIYSGVPIKIINNLEKEKAVFNKKMLNEICKNDNQYANALCKTFKARNIEQSVEEGHHKIWDELVVISFLYPEYFKWKLNAKDYPISLAEDYEICKSREAILHILGYDSLHQYIVFEEFPHTPEMFREDVAPFVDEIIAKHGIDEWRACLLTNEIHGHLGIYSLVGAKMGIKAREYFNVGLDELEVISYAGNHPPISCLNDGLQISTGATLGQGSISIVTDSIPKPEAIFKYGSKQVKMSIKPEYRKKFRSDIENALLQYDLSQAGYWKLVRELAIRYWLELDRNELFIIEEVK